MYLTSCFKIAVTLVNCQTVKKRLLQHPTSKTILCVITRIMKTMASRVFLGNGGMFHRALIFMLKLGWQSRFRLPMLLIIVSIAIGNRVPLEVEFENTEQHNSL